jgi:ribosomal 50S subunit-associated protein YjgA (DUF615 family)
MRQTIKGGSGALEKVWKTFTDPSDKTIEQHLIRQTHRKVIENKVEKKAQRLYSGVTPLLVGPYHPYYEKDRAKRRRGK